MHRGTVPLCTHLEEHPALQFHEAVVGHRIREVTLEVDADEVQVVVLEIVECAEMEHNQNRPVGGFLFFLAKKLRPSLRVENFFSPTKMCKSGLSLHRVG